MVSKFILFLLILVINTSAVLFLPNLSDGNVLRTTQMSDRERSRILQATGNNRLRKIEATLAANILQRKELERQLARHKLTYPLSTNSIKETR